MFFGENVVKEQLRGHVLVILLGTGVLDIQVVAIRLYRFYIYFPGERGFLAFPHQASKGWNSSNWIGWVLE